VQRSSGCAQRTSRTVYIVTVLDREGGGHRSRRPSGGAPEHVLGAAVELGAANLLVSRVDAREAGGGALLLAEAVGACRRAAVHECVTLALRPRGWGIDHRAWELIQRTSRLEERDIFCRRHRAPHFVTGEAMGLRAGACSLPQVVRDEPIAEIVAEARGKAEVCSCRGRRQRGRR